MHRQLYPFLLLAAIALAVVVCLRPGAAEELISLVRSGAGRYLPQPGYSEDPGVPANGYRPTPVALTQAASGAESARWYASAAPGNAQPRQQWGTADYPPQNAAIRSPLAETYGVDAGGQYGESNGVVYAPAAGRYRAGGATADWEPGQVSPQRYPVAGAGRAGSIRQGVAGETAAEARLCEGARILARVGDAVILANEVMLGVEEEFAGRRAQVPPSQHELLRKVLTMRALQDRIGFKLVYQDARRTIPEEAFPNVEKQIGKQFAEKELPRRLKRAGVGSLRELEEIYRRAGTSLEREKRAFQELALAADWIRQQDKMPEEQETDQQISYDEMLEYYQRHKAEFSEPARARWEHVWVRIPRYTDGRGAQAGLAHVGNQVMLGTPVSAAIEAQPGGGLVCQGGDQGWITEGSDEVSRRLQEVIFGLPLGRPSKMFRDGEAWHIVRVLERESATCPSFEQAQTEIADRLRSLRRQEKRQAYLARLRREIPVWTVFDDDVELAELRRQSEAPRR